MSTELGRGEAVELHVSLWAHVGNERALTEYENRVLALLADHDANLVARVSPLPTDVADLPTEIHIIRFATQAAFDAYMVDPRRAAMSAERDAAVARTLIVPVTSVG
jgi:uncharacterized protein (DUF1330 family)